MWEVTLHSLSQLREDDLNAITTFLLDQPELGQESEAPEDVDVADARIAAGEELYGVHCYTCHQAEGRGIQAAAPTLAGSATVTARQPYNAIMAILQGFEARDTWPQMPAYAKVLTDRDVADLVNFLRTNWTNAAEPNAAAAAMVGSWRAAGDFPEYDANAEPQFVCPVLSTTADFDDADREELAALEPGEFDGDTLSGLVEAYQSRHPDQSSADVTAAFLGGYCPTLEQEELSYDEKSHRLARLIGAVAALAQPDAPSDG